MPGHGKTIRGRYSQTDLADQHGEVGSAKARTACEEVLESAIAQIEAIQRRHRERWVQHHLFMRKTAVWKEEPSLPSLQTSDRRSYAESR